MPSLSKHNSFYCFFLLRRNLQNFKILFFFYKVGFPMFLTVYYSTSVVRDVTALMLHVLYTILSIFCCGLPFRQRLKYNTR